jgi:predicted membrane protein
MRLSEISHNFFNLYSHWERRPVRCLSYLFLALSIGAETIYGISWLVGRVSSESQQPVPLPLLGIAAEAIYGISQLIDRVSSEIHDDLLDLRSRFSF